MATDYSLQVQRDLVYKEVEGLDRFCSGVGSPYFDTIREGHEGNMGDSSCSCQDRKDHHF